MQALRVRDTLTNLPLFEGVEPALIERLAASSRRCTAAGRAKIVDRGDAVTGILIVLHGLFEITILSEGGEVATLGFLGPGAIVGDAAVLDDGVYGVGVAAGPECEYLWLDAPSFLRGMRESAALSCNVAKALSRRLRMMFCRDEWTNTRSVPRRLAHFLVWMREQQGERSGAVLRVTQEQLGHLVGVSRETVNKHLRRWVQAGWIEQRGGAITLLAPAELLAEENSTAA